MPIAFLPLPTETARAYRSGAPDAYGNPPERVTCPGHGAPCRHCLDYIPVGAEMLILAHSPFGARAMMPEILQMTFGRWASLLKSRFH